VAAYLKLKPELTVVVAASDLIPDASRVGGTSWRNHLAFQLHLHQEEAPFHLELGGIGAGGRHAHRAGRGAGGLAAADLLTPES
jgi:hypothetical protein